MRFLSVDLEKILKDADALTMLDCLYQLYKQYGKQKHIYKFVSFLETVHTTLQSQSLNQCRLTGQEITKTFQENHKQIKKDNLYLWTILMTKKFIITELIHYHTTQKKKESFVVIENKKKEPITASSWKKPSLTIVK